MANFRTAEEIFSGNIGRNVIAGLVSWTDDGRQVRMKGELKKIMCNCFFIRNEDGFTEMFRYEDLVYFKVL